MGKKTRKQKKKNKVGKLKQTNRKYQQLSDRVMDKILGEGTKYYMSIKRILKSVQRKNMRFAVSFFV